MKDGNAAMTLLEKWPEKNSGFEWDLTFNFSFHVWPKT